ncbi:MAG: type II toxin-antitoxin system VapC family toxin [Treponema sp.]|nr:type II toxin-antitoxin system VapC family toxin [Treponema sp.]
MNCVLDASAAFEIAFNGAESEKMRSLVEQADVVYAPHLYIAEVSNVLWKYVQGGFVSERDAQTTLVLALQYVDLFIDCGENAVESLHEGNRLKHSIYNMFYFTLARRNSALLLTKDKKLKMLAKKEGVETA